MTRAPPDPARPLPGRVAEEPGNGDVVRPGRPGPLDDHPGERPRDGGKLRLVLVEDSAADALFVEELCRAWARVTHVERLADVAGALEAPCDLLLLDIWLPDAHGLEGLRRVRAAHPCVPVLVLTGGDGRFATSALREGAQDYLTKDRLDEPTLTRAVMHGLARSVRVRALETRHERARREARALREALDGVPAALVLFDAQDRIVLANRAAHDWLVPPGASHADEVPLLRRSDDRARSRGVAEARLDVGGEPRDLLYLVAETTWLGAPHLCLAACDVTELGSADGVASAVRESGRFVALGELAASVAHEINNPLAAITANLEALSRRRGALRRGDGPLVGECLEASRRVAAIVNDLLTFVRGAGRREATYVDLRRVAESALRLTAAKLRRERVSLETRLATVPTVAALEGRLVQVAVNLLSNAAEALNGRPNRHVVVETGTFRDGVFLAVEDDGPGMTPEVLRRAREPFFTTKGSRGGTGLGLAISNDLAGAHGGTLDIRSTPGRGTRVELRLPHDTGLVVRHAASPSSAPPLRGVDTTPTRVLLVDDEPMVRRAYARLLAPECHVHACGSAAEALERLARDPGYDLLLVDVDLPDGSGVDLARSVLARWPDLERSLVFFTGGSLDPASEGLGPGVRVLTKPVDRGTLLALARRGARRRTRRPRDG